MPFKDLEHNGNEDFDSLSNRVVAKSIEDRDKQILKDSEAKLLEIAQQKWLSPSNPLLWDRLD